MGDETFRRNIEDWEQATDSAADIAMSLPEISGRCDPGAIAAVFWRLSEPHQRTGT